MRAALVLGLVLVAVPARADDREDARREFAAGQDADKRNDWQTAIEHYLRANDLKPHPFAIFNIATDYERLGQLREAATWYERYLVAAKDSPDRAKVEKTLADLKIRPAKLTVRTTPPGAKLAVDGARIGVTPYTGVTRGGAHHIVVELGGRRDERDVAIEYGEPAVLELELAVPPSIGGPDTATPDAGPRAILIVTGPQGASVTVDGNPAGIVPATIPVAAGSHAVHVEAMGYTAFDSTATVTAGQSFRVDAVMPRALGTVDATPKILIGYVVGVAAGADAKGSGVAWDGSFGLRAAQYEGLVRYGRIAGIASFDLVLRWAFTASRLSPFVGVGYAYVTSGWGYEFTGGLRWDITRSNTFAVSALAEGALRYSSHTDDTTGSTVTDVIYPIELGLELVYR